LSKRRLNLRGDRKHLFKDAFQRHRMAADAAKMEKFAIALPFTLFESDLMIIVVAAESDGKLVKMESIGFFSVPFCLLDLADHAVVHGSSPWEKKRHAGAMAPCLWDLRQLSIHTAHGGFPPRRRIIEV
jgi:hypothetical protein